jgi:hypothetical protein
MSMINKCHIGCLLIVLRFASINAAFADIQQEPNFTVFYQALEKQEDDKAEEIGQTIFEHIERKYHVDSGFGTLKSKMTAAEFLAGQMVTQLKKATGRQLFAVTGELFENGSKNKNKNLLSVAPAKSFYETSLKIFSKQINIYNFEDQEKQFLAKYYDLKLRILTSSIAKAGQALTIAEPSFQGTYDYVLVLPLLHTSEAKPINVDILPKWMRQSQQLDIFSDSCLMHYGFAYHAQVFANQSAKLRQKDFSQGDFYRTAAKKSEKQFPRVAVDCLQRAIGLIDEKKIDEKVDLQFDVVKIWLDSENFTLAAGEAKKIIEGFPDHKRCGNAIWLYYYALSKANNVDSILADIDTVIPDPKCSDYRMKLMYIKWWALRRKRDQVALIAALEHQLISEYNNNQMIAPIMLSRATDLLARQDYTGAFALLNQLQEKFPYTIAAQQARKMMEKLEVLQGSK